MRRVCINAWACSAVNRRIKLCICVATDTDAGDVQSTTDFPNILWQFIERKFRSKYIVVNILPIPLPMEYVVGVIIFYISPSPSSPDGDLELCPNWTWWWLSKSKCKDMNTQLPITTANQHDEQRVSRTSGVKELSTKRAQSQIRCPDTVIWLYSKPAYFPMLFASCNILFVCDDSVAAYISSRCVYDLISTYSR